MHFFRVRILLETIQSPHPTLETPRQRQMYSMALSTSPCIAKAFIGILLAGWVENALISKFVDPCIECYGKMLRLLLGMDFNQVALQKQAEDHLHIH
jgi:hypothetical protein